MRSFRNLKMKLGDFFAKLLFTLIVLAVCGIPAWLWLGIRHITNPQGFLQNFLLVGMGLWLLGTVQFVLGILAIGLLIAVWTDSL